MNAHCLDERAEGALGLVEGSAQYYAAVAVAEDPSIDLSDLLQALAQSASGDSPPPGVPRFVFNQELWPYTAGEAFVASLAAGGTAAVDHAFEHLPVSTEQIIDPSRYPSDRPQQVSIPDVAGDLGSRWGDLDAMTIGEQWLRDMLGLREGVSPDAATGWGGGGYRAWTDGRNVVVVLRTSWDQPDQAATFASALRLGRRPALPPRWCTRLRGDRGLRDDGPTRITAGSRQRGLSPPSSLPPPPPTTGRRRCSFERDPGPARAHRVDGGPGVSGGGTRCAVHRRGVLFAVARARADHPRDHSSPGPHPPVRRAAGSVDTGRIATATTRGTLSQLDPAVAQGLLEPPSITLGERSARRPRASGPASGGSPRSSPPERYRRVFASCCTTRKGGRDAGRRAARADPGDARVRRRSGAHGYLVMITPHPSLMAVHGAACGA